MIRAHRLLQGGSRPNRIVGTISATTKQAFHFVRVEDGKMLNIDDLLESLPKRLHIIFNSLDQSPLADQLKDSLD